MGVRGSCHGLILLIAAGWVVSCDFDALTREPSSTAVASEQASNREIQQLEALGYLGGHHGAPTQTGVLRYDETRAFPGLNFYVSAHGPEAILMAMDGSVLHRWSYDFGSEWREAHFGELASSLLAWTRARLQPNGDVLAIHSGLGLVKVDSKSNLLWHYEGKAHHDLDVLEDGVIYVLTREARIIPRIHPTKPSQDDFITVLSPEGVEEQRVSILRSIERSRFRELLELLPPHGDLFHANAVKVLDGRFEERLPAFRRGNVLVSLLMLSAIVVVDMERKEVVWVLRNGFEYQHNPTVLNNGNLLLFDNLGPRVRARRAAGRRSNRRNLWLSLASTEQQHRQTAWEIGSAVLEIDPVSRNTVWSYLGSAKQPFYSGTLGTAHRLANGNTLITESEFGRAFEVTEAGEIVWEFVNPHRWPVDPEKTAVIYDLQRLPADLPMSWRRD